MHRAAVVILAVASPGVLACSSGTVDHASPPTSADYDIEFPSTAAAVSADTIQTFVFSTSTPKTDCASLLVARESGSGLPTALVQTNPVPLCSFLAGTSGQVTGVAYGNVSFLVVAQRAGVDYFTGCALATLSATSAPVSVQLQQATTEHIPDTDCMSVSDHCASPPNCTVGDGGS